MEIPSTLKAGLEKELGKYKISELRNALNGFTEKYLSEKGDGERIVTREVEALSYAACRMTATYAAVYSALEHSLNMIKDEYIPRRIFDIGAGCGAASFAANELINLDDLRCFEREPAMINLGKTLMNEDEFLKDAYWKSFDVTKDHLQNDCDMILASYVINELMPDDRIDVPMELFNHCKMMLIVEPGTKQGYENIKKLRNEFIKKGAHIIAPCTHNKECALDQDDWCHFTSRISRTKAHMQIKEVEVPYEDEKFSYLFVSHDDIYNEGKFSRVLRHPIIEPGKIELRLCNDDGTITNKVIYKKDEDFKKARKSNSGDEF